MTASDPGGWDLQVAKLALVESKVAAIDAERVGQLIDNRTAEALAITAEISAKREIDTNEWEHVSNSRVREYHFTSDVSGTSTDHAMDTLTRWNRLDKDQPERPYKFVICSPGGSVIHGMKLYNVIKGIATKRPMITVASGLCASMGTIIHQAGNLRVIEPGCSYLIHDVSGESFGTIGSMQDTVDWMNKLNHSLHVALAEQSKLSVEEVAALSKRRDAWFMPEEILSMGLADVIEFSLNVYAGMSIPEVVEAVKITPIKKSRARKDVEAKS